MFKTDFCNPILMSYVRYFEQSTSCSNSSIPTYYTPRSLWHRLFR